MVNLSDYDMIVFLSVPRSGHNAIMNWFMLQMPFRCNFYAIVNASDPQIEKKKFKPRKKKNAQIYNENNSQNIDVLNAEYISIEHLELLKEKKPFFLKKKIFPIIILRSYRNHLASVIGAKLISNNNASVFKPIWIDHAEAILENKCDYILYDKWHIDEDYRKEICDRYGLEFTDAGKNDIPNIGAPWSSFDLKAFDGKASQMDVLNRYKKRVGKHKDYEKNYTEDVQELEAKIFDDILHPRKDSNPQSKV